MSRWPAHAALAALLVAVGVASYGPVRDAQFLAFDDQDYVYANPNVTGGLSAQGVGWAFRDSHSGNWHPLTWLSHQLDVSLFGLAPGGHHAVSLALHVLNAVLLFWVVSGMTGKIGASFVLAALFAVHPANLEVVGWVSQRKTLLSTAFAIVAIGAYCAHARSGRRSLQALALLAFAGSLLAKQTFVTLPVLLLLLDVWPLGRLSLDARDRGARTAGIARLASEKIPYVALAAAAGLLTLGAQQDAIQSLEAVPLGVRLGNALVSYVRYLATLLWPTRLAIFHPLHPDDVTPGAVLGAALLLLALTFVTLRFGVRRRYLAVGWLWFVVSLLPMIGILQVGGQARADRYLYSASWGVGIAVIWLVASWVETARHALLARSLAAAGAAAAILSLAWSTHERAGRWLDTESVFTEAVANAGPNWRASQLLAVEAVKRGDPRTALAHCEASLADEPRAFTYAVRGVAWKDLGDAERAIADLERAMELDPQGSFAAHQLALVRAERGETDRALELIERAARAALLAQNRLQSPRPALIHQHWGNLLERSRRPDAALEQYRAALRYEPANLEALVGAARIETNRGAREAAREHLQQALELVGTQGDADAGRTSADLRVQLGDASFAQGLIEEAVRQYRLALQDAQGHVGAANNLAWILATAADAGLRNPKEALALTEAILAAPPSDPRMLADLLDTRAAALASDGQFDAAVAAIDEALANARRAQDPRRIAALEARRGAYAAGRAHVDDSIRVR